ncbi:FIG00003370: Multicopper polyphenol oxidase [hydrothermal vent metagenome]|uniref:FIG00003370: Multicopper polyphenol oxidase n=1 Tax=hydrothermal vent metagenome TaxID=652676 RepID=A0A3B1BYQ2_9ZZZZ
MKNIANLFPTNLLKSQPELTHAFSPRSLKRKDGTMGELNFASDDPLARLNLQWFLRSIGINKEDVFLVRQVHGDVVYDLKNTSASPAQVAEVQADAIITRLTDMPIGVLTADCVPVVVYDTRLQVTGVIHAGRKGTALKIVSKTIRAMQNFYGCDLENILVEMGPGIGGCCYEVDKDCIEPFKKLYPDLASMYKPLPSGKFMLDLFVANEEDARMAGIDPKNISQSGICTSCQVEHFFSYRREGKTGRMLTVAMLTPR